MVVSGPPTLTASALARLEVICDSYLSVSTPVQMAASRLMQAGATVRAAIQSRINGNLTVLERLIGSESAVSLLVPEGGWSAVLRVPSTDSEEALVLRLIREAQVLVHPGYFYDFSSEAFLVLSLLPDPTVFEAAVKRVLAEVEVGRPQ
jgi:aspartate/methionine/tyrosine aminotransferase